MNRVERGSVAVAGTGRLAERELGATYLEARPNPNRSFYQRVGKRFLDVVLVLLSLPVVLPLIGLFALALWMESGRPFYSQKRVGQGGRIFNMLKLRTMVLDADQLLDKYLAADPALRKEWDETQKLKFDPRTTPIGRLLRASSLDELPQLLNVLAGQMSLVGARPIMVSQLEIYGKSEGYFALRPGLTGPWQVGGRNETSFFRRADIDKSYCWNVTLLGDLRILVKTVSVVLRSTGY
ncbi:sugar transferase [Tritonibacter horizontis]|uniref:Undecaprenyl phosphate N,N'-diacetylbacillosamine 1-phosphate transferase n=1 Tax=Tritonibacter horizontis TaxID=1768241 RepID=A0A132BWK0_9RHOB|nr:sugar transferase [Tritonibacter horizontis]KUP92432.1 undecaprenyl phosphate N,N'-diacetylbacillosamine 1-phosphate transferase [Tritonibacter horizontis]